MAATTGWQAGIESNDTDWSYAQELIWGTPPAIAYQALRTTGNDSIARNEQRGRPPEKTALAERSAAVTQQVSAGGGLPFALSYNTYDDLLAGLLRSEWGAAVVINGAGGDIVLAASGNKMTSPTAGKFAALQVGMWVNLSGFALQPGRVARVQAKTSDTDVTLSGFTLVNETPAGTLAKVRAGGMLVNDTVFKSFTYRQRLGALGYRHIPGSFHTAGQLSATLGDFLTGSFTLAAKDEVKSLTDIATSLTPAPIGRVHDNVKGWGGLFFDGVKVAATLRSTTFNIANEGAAADYGKGDPAAAGMRKGTFGADMEVQLLFRDWSLYDRAVNSALSGIVSAVTLDAAGNAYVLELLNGNAINPRIQAGRPGDPVMSTISIEGNPQAAGGTMRIMRLPAA